MFTPVERQAYRRKLYKLLARAAEDRHELRAEALQPIGGEASGGISNVPVHLADLANRSCEEDVSLTLLETEEGRMAEINLALERLRHGTFGRCESCRRPIAKRRLRSLPYTRCCFGCERRREEHAAD